ncbi:MAG: hypothetical protein QXO71_03700 [Candidatus Jordarchaeaceae archaeon]
MGNLFLASLYNYTESPRKGRKPDERKPDEKYRYVSKIVQENNCLSVGENGYSENSFEIGQVKQNGLVLKSHCRI